MNDDSASTSSTDSAKTTDGGTSVGDDFPHQQARVRELLGVYKSLGPPGAFGALMLEECLRRADAAAISGDIVEIIRSYQELKGCE